MANASTSLGCSSAHTYGPGTTRGQIFVDTPEVFTRERIVNDRFEQVSWLEKQLRRADNSINFSLQGLQQQGVALGISASGNLTIGKNILNTKSKVIVIEVASCIHTFERLPDRCALALTSKEDR